MLFAPGKASNAGGVATSGLEMSQNAMRLSWPREEVDARLHDHAQHPRLRALRRGRRGVNYVDGANVAGFVKVADAMLRRASSDGAVAAGSAGDALAVPRAVAAGSGGGECFVGAVG